MHRVAPPLPAVININKYIRPLELANTQQHHQSITCNNFIFLFILTNIQITSLTLLPLVSFMQSNQVLFIFNVKVPQQYIYDIQQS